MECIVSELEGPGKGPGKPRQDAWNIIKERGTQFI